jgi:aspartate dehydrogenase
MRTGEGSMVHGRQRKRVGLVGCGTIGSRVARRIMQEDLGEIVFLCDLDPERARRLSSTGEVITDPTQIGDRGVDLVVEAANADVMRRIALEVLERADFLPFTVTALADDDFREEVRARCRERGTRLFIPHGGVLGLDGVSDGRGVIREVTFKTTKHPRNLGLRPDEVGVVYDGPTRGACERFPRNVNVHAAFALMGVGFDRQRSIVISDPETREMRHEISVSGEGIEWRFSIASVPSGAVTGSYTPESAASTVARILGGVNDIVLG